MLRLPIRRVLLTTLVLALLAFFLPPLINANRFRARIATGLGEALGRPVSIGYVGLHLLPEPGFDLQNLVVSELPPFGAEPVLRAGQVSASVRLSSLWRGRMEIASLSLKNPSLNLVRLSDGQWNVESLLERAARTPAAPTAQPRAEERPRFPYIQAEDGRINLKLGREKTAFSLTEADFALWLASENEWRMRLSARPVRTDVNISDTGVLKVNGKLQRALHLHDLPLNVNIFLSGAQLGQITKLVYGRDRGWRGAVEINAALSGTPANLNVVTQASINDFRRYDIGTLERLRVDVRCTGNYSSVSQQLSGMNCQLPVGSGMVSATGSFQGLSRPRMYELNFTAEKVPMQALVGLARHAKKDIPDDLKASGDLELAFKVRKTDVNNGAVWSGGGSTTAVVLRSGVLTSELPLGALQFAVEAPRNQKLVNGANGQGGRVAPATAPPIRLSFAPLAVALGGPSPVAVRGWISGSQYDLEINGDARIARALQAARAIGLRVPQATVDGSAKLNLTVAGNWAGFAGPMPVGKAQLRNVTASIHGFTSRLQLASAKLSLAPDLISLSDMDAGFRGAGLDFTGSLQVPRGCDSAEQCPVQFDLRAGEISTDDLNRLLNPRFAKRPWYDVFAGATTSVLSKAQAKGHISASRVLVKSVVLSRVTAAVELQRGRLQLKDVAGDVLGGKYRGAWQADFTTGEPAYSGTGSLNSVAMAQLATLMRDRWATGTFSAKYQVTMNGWTASDLLASAVGTANFRWNNGVLRHISLGVPVSIAGNKTKAPDSTLLRPGPLQFREFSGTAELRDGIIRIGSGRMATQSAIYEVNGTASLARQVELKITNGGFAYSVTGTLTAPKVAAALNQAEIQSDFGPQ
ncbi:MAG: AsmA family protein [Terriglobales bacterium]